MTGPASWTLAGRLYAFAVLWTVGLITLGSVVHATGSSLACPDWPLCFGQVMPRMVGGVFWEHLHRLVAGGLIVIWGIAIWALRSQGGGGGAIERLSWLGLGLLLVQAVFGGLTVIYRLPDAVSTTHLGLAFVFLALAFVVASATGRWTGRPSGEEPADDPQADRVSRAALWVAILVFVQSLSGALVRHMDAGTACPDFPLCQGRVIPVFADPLVTVHFIHRLLALAVLVAVAWLARRVAKRTPADAKWGWTAFGLVAAQVLLGIFSVLARLSVELVSAHTLGAALLLLCLVRLARLDTLMDDGPGNRRRAVGAAN
ncbi:MAG: heme A synthase [Gemmatimonadetes bacterium]|nr:heme A synthase [Gemmatimonadota bacterium]